MRKLLTGVSLVALAALFALPAAAQTATATATNTGAVTGNQMNPGVNSDNTATINGGTGNNAQGVIQVNQNAGANSLLQNTTALAYIEANIFLFVPTNPALNVGTVTGNLSDRINDSDNRSDIDGSFGGGTGVRGVVNVNQNTGDNSLLQNATAIAALIDCLCEQGNGAAGQQTAFGNARNTGTGGGGAALVAANTARALAGSDSRAFIRNGAFDNAQGAIQVNQNAAANSLLQNATSIAYVDTRLFEDRSLARAENLGQVGPNTSIRDGSLLNSADITSSFNGSVQGSVNVNQNAGNNSLLQNATAIAALIDCFCGPDSANPNIADAAAVNTATVGTSNNAQSTNNADSSAVINASFTGAAGIVQVNQNAGANSALQNATALAYLESRISGDQTLAVATNSVAVVGNLSIRAGGSDTLSTIAASFVGAEGAINVNQNSGDNSLLQNATAIAALVNCDCDESSNQTLVNSSTARATNTGTVQGNRAETTASNADAQIIGSFGGFAGVAQVNQNAAANSLLQNATAIGRMDAKLGDPGGANDTANSVATAINNGNDLTNQSLRATANNRVLMNSSFSGAQGSVNVNQNAGDNSLLQNATAIAALIDCNCDTNDDAAQDVETVTIVATATNTGNVTGNTARTTAGPSNSSVSMLNSFGVALGVMQASQNAGANSLLQNAAAVGYVRARLEDDGGASATTTATAANTSSVAGNRSERTGSANSATMSASFSIARGIANVNQNAGDNSALQNATALGAIQYCGPRCLSANLTAVAAATNAGVVSGNVALATNSSASATMSSSFQGYQGLANVNQNAGANSLLQNTIAVGAIFPGNTNLQVTPLNPVTPLQPINPVR
jgi:hypothetical protein